MLIVGFLCNSLHRHSYRSFSGEILSNELGKSALTIYRWIVALVCFQQIHVTSNAHQCIFDSIDLNWNMLAILGSGRSVSAQSLAYNVLSDLQFKPTNVWTIECCSNIYINSVYIHFSQIHKWISIKISILFIKIFQVWLKRIPSGWPFKFKDWIHI